MSQSPTDLGSDRQSLARRERYITAWKTVAELLENGRTFSGYERNCAFLNTAGPRFAEISAISGFDLLADSRAAALVDWDRDGDLDVWLTHRTGPRATYLQNDSRTGHHYLALRLEGKSCNRDAVGARISLRLANGMTQIRTLRAGEGFLSQSSKWLSFGLGQEKEIEQVAVRWPGGREEIFSGVRADGRYWLVQHTGQARREPTLDAPPPFPDKSISLDTIPDRQGTLLARRLPWPDGKYLDMQGDEHALMETHGRPRLLLLWAGWCLPCLAEMKALSEQREEIEEAGISILALNVDGVTRPVDEVRQDIEKVAEQISIPGEMAIATEELLQGLDVSQQVISLRRRALGLPMGFLLDEAGLLVGVYRGAVPTGRLIADVQRMREKWSDPRDAAVPFEGRWFTSPFPPDLLAIVEELLRAERPRRAWDYYITHVRDSEIMRDAEAGKLTGITSIDLAALCFRMGEALIRANASEEALVAFEEAVHIRPDFWNARFALATIRQQQGNFAEAITQYREMLRIRPNDAMSMNNLAWLLATAPHGDPDEAVDWARKACELTGQRNPSTLDTLGVALAAEGDFEEAIEKAELALRLAEAAGQAELADRLRSRLAGYREGQSTR